MPLENLPDPILVTRQGPLRRMVEALSREALVAVDTESNSLYAYQERVCLIQFSTPKQDFLVDPLALEDLSPLGAIFAEARIEKVFHAAEYDLITLKRDFGFTFANIFDTMVAARVLGWEEVGLGAMLKAELGVELDKRLQRANWGRRPLPADMLAYARLDTHYLIPLRQRLINELKARGRWQLAVEDFGRLEQVNGRAPEDQPSMCWRISGAHELSSRQAAVLQELCRHRDQIARMINKPLFKVVSDRALLSMAAAMPRNLAELQRLPGWSPRQIHQHGEGFLRAVQQGLQAKPLAIPRQPRPDEGYLSSLEALRTWRKNKATEIGVASDVVLPRDLMHALAFQQPGCQEELAAVMNQTTWRLEQFGDEILSLLKRR